MRYITFMLCLVLAGCGTRTDTQTDTVIERTNGVTLQGTVNGMPVDLRMTHQGVDTIETDTASRTTLEMPAFMSGAGGGLLSLIPGGDVLGPLLGLLLGGGAAEAVHRRKRRRDEDLMKRRMQILADAEPEVANKTLEAL